MCNTFYDIRLYLQMSKNYMEYKRGSKKRHRITSMASFVTNRRSTKHNLLYFKLIYHWNLLVPLVLFVSGRELILLDFFQKCGMRET